MMLLKFPRQRSREKQVLEVRSNKNTWELTSPVAGDLRSEPGRCEASVVTATRPNKTKTLDEVTARSVGVNGCRRCGKAGQGWRVQKETKILAQQQDLCRLKHAIPMSP